MEFYLGCLLEESLDPRIYVFEYFHANFVVLYTVGLQFKEIVLELLLFL